MTCAKDPARVPAPWIAHPAFIAHMNMLQAVVVRLAGNSASCKTWCSGLVTALMSLAGSTHAPQLLPLALVPIVIFAFLDVNYLSQERRFRKQFEQLAGKARSGQYECQDLFAFGDRGRMEAGKELCRAFFSWSILPYYSGLIVVYFWVRHAGWLDLLAPIPGAGK